MPKLAAIGLVALSVLAPSVLAQAATADTAATDVTIETSTGPATLAVAPETVAVFDLAALDTLTALGVPIAGVPNNLYLPMFDDLTKGATPVGTIFEPDFEALAVMQPDLIVVGGRSSEQLGPVSDIAPAIDMTLIGDDLVTEARDRIAAYGALFGREDRATALTRQLDDKLSAARDAAADRGTALILLTNGGKISAYGRDSRFGWIHEALELPQAHPGLDVAPHGQAVSFEFIAETDPDWLLVVDRGAAIGADGESARATLDNPIVAGTKAAQSGQIIYLDAGPLYISGGGAASMMHTLDELTEAFSATES